MSWMPDRIHGSSSLVAVRRPAEPNAPPLPPRSCPLQHWGAAMTAASATLPLPPAGSLETVRRALPWLQGFGRPPPESRPQDPATA